MSKSQSFRPRGLTAAALALALSACASTGGLQPKGQIHDADAQLASQESLGQYVRSGAEFPAANWWTAFGDPQLDTLIREALAAQPSLDAANARVDLANAQLGLITQEDKWQGQAVGQISGVQLPETIIPEPIGGEFKATTIGRVQFSKTFDVWGSNKAKQAQSLDAVHAAQVDVQAARLSIAANIARAYVGLDQAYRAKDVAAEERQRNEALLNLASARVRKGLDNELQVRNSQMAIASAQQLSFAADQQIALLKHAIAALMGQGPDRGNAITRPSLKQAGRLGVPSVLPSELLGHRPDLVAARWRVEAAAKGIDVAKAAFYPTINLSGMAGLAAADVMDLFSAKALLLQVGPSISLPLFAQGRLQGQLAVNDAQYDLAVAQYNGLLAGALREVADALTSNRTLDAQIGSLQMAVDAARKAEAIAVARYRAGLGTQIDVLNAQRPLLQMNQQLVALKAQKNQTLVDLNTALGGGVLMQGN